jgi:hypothetical protein
MMAFFFILIFIAVLFAWKGQRRKAIYCVSLALMLALLFFYHDMTTQLTVQL